MGLVFSLGEKKTFSSLSKYVDVNNFLLAFISIVYDQGILHFDVENKIEMDLLHFILLYRARKHLSEEVS